jgi:hypothetical protein
MVAALTPTFALNLRSLRDKIVQTLKNGHGKIAVAIDGDGAPVNAETIVTVQMQPDENVEAFLVRVWAQYKPLPHDRIEWSCHEGRLTAKIISSGGRMGDIDQVLEQLGKLQAQVAALSAHLAEGE